MRSAPAMKSKDEASALAVTLQSITEPYDARKAACDALLAASCSDSSCSVLCSVGAIHSAFVAVKTAGELPALLKSALALLCNLSKFDSKLVSVVARLQVLRPLSALLPWHVPLAAAALRCAALSHRAKARLAHPPAHACPSATQGGLSGLLDAVREQLALPGSDPMLLRALLHSLGDVTGGPQNAQLLAKENGVAVLLGCVLSHL